jgi:hypothetical protein
LMNRTAFGVLSNGLTSDCQRQARRTNLSIKLSPPLIELEGKSKVTRGQSDRIEIGIGDRPRPGVATGYTSE